MNKILIIEDEFDVTKVLRKRLMEHNFRVASAADAYQGVKFVHEEKPDLIILDLKLPAGGGLAVLKNIRMSAKTCYIPIVVLTGMQDEKYKKKIMDEGVDAYLEKPYDINELVGAINTILQNKNTS